jgi:hypothetical protein
MQLELEIELSWPPSVLNPNIKAHWRTKHQWAKVYKHEAYILSKKGYRFALMAEEPINVHVIFYPPDNRHRDEDNMLASLKAALDGIAQAIGVDDRWFRISHEVGEVVKEGAVIVRLTGIKRQKARNE